MEIPAKLLLGVLFLAAIGFLALLILTPPHAVAVPVSPTPLALNLSGTPTPTVELAARTGDTVFVDYTLTVENGTVFDTSIESVAVAAGLYRAGIEYAPLNVTIGAGQVITGFDSALIGMKVGDRKNISLAAKDAYGEYNSSLVSVTPRTYSVSRVEPVALADFLYAFPGFNFSTNFTISTGEWNATIISHANDTVIIRHDPRVNQTIETSNWPETVIALNDTSITLRRDPEQGKTYVIKDAYGAQHLGKLLGMSEDIMMLDLNHPLAGQALNFSLALVSITRP